MSQHLPVHIIDDDEAARQSLAFMLEAYGLEVVAHDSASAFLAEAPTEGIGCIVTDVRMPGLSGMELLVELKQRQLVVPVILVTGHGDVPMAVEAMRIGAADFLEKPYDDSAMCRSVRLALERNHNQREIDGRRQDIRRRLDSLSPREMQVLEGLVAGHANKRIAFDLDISPRTVEI
jgi:two-component system, LuxR family, response regulator FixJ